MNPIQQAIEACEWVQLVFTDDTMAQERDPELWMPKMGEALTSLRSLQTASGFGMKLIPQASGFSADPEAPAGVQVPQEVLDALFYVDDYIARVNGDDRGSCESVNVLRRFLDSLAADPEAPAQVQPEHELQALEREHLGDFDKRTGIYATQPTQAEAPSDGWHASGLGEVHSPDHKQMIYCEAEDANGEMVASDDLARRVRAALATQQAVQAEPVAAQHRFRHPQKGTPDWSEWQPCKVSNRPAREIDSQGYEVEYRALGVIATPPAPGQVERDKEASELLDWLDAKNKPFKMGWQVGVAPAGNVVVKSVIYPITEPVSIRAAIRAARSSEGGGNEHSR